MSTAVSPSIPEAKAAGGVSVNGTGVVSVIGTIRQITTSPSNHYDPSISGNIVVYTATPTLVPQEYIYDLSSGIETQLTTGANGADSGDVSGNTIVYVDYSGAAGGQVNVFTIGDGHVAVAPSSTLDQSAPGIRGSIVAWVANGGPVTFDVFAKDLSTGTVKQITSTAAVESHPNVDGSMIVYASRTGASSNIVVTDFNTLVSRQLTSTGLNSSPDISGNHVVYQAVLADGDQDIHVFDLSAGVDTRISLPGVQRNPHVDGDWVTFEDVSSGTSAIRLYHIPTASLFTAFSSPTSNGFLNDISGNRIVFTGDATGNEEIYVYEFTAQLPSPLPTSWAKTYGGTGNDIANSVQQTSDGGFIVAGSITGAFGFPVTSAWVLRLDAFGNVEWQKAYGLNSTSAASSVQQTSDGGFIVAGTASFFSGPLTAWVFKLDALGNMVWQKKAGFSEAFSARQTSDGGFIVAGSDIFSAGIGANATVLKLDAVGNLVWQRTYLGVNLLTGLLSIRQTSDGGYVAAGETLPLPGAFRDAWVLRLNSTGGIIWQKTYGGTGDDAAASVQQTSDGGFIVAAHTTSFGAGFRDAWVLRLDSSGNLVWQKTYGGVGFDAAFSAKQTFDGGFVVAGLTDSFGAGSSDAWVLRLNSLGNVVWQKTYGGTGNDVANAVQQTSDGGFIVAGSTTSFGAGSSDAWVLRVDANGNIGCLCNLIRLSAAAVANTKATVATPTMFLVPGATVTAAFSGAFTPPFATQVLCSTLIRLQFGSTYTLDSTRVQTAGNLTIDTQSFTVVSGGVGVAAFDAATSTLTFNKVYPLSGLQLVRVGTSSTFQAKFLVDVRVLPYALSSDIIIQVNQITCPPTVSASTLLTRELDINADGTVDIIDVSIAAASYGTVLGNTKYNPLADFNADGTINIIDIAIIAAYYGAPAFH